MGKKPIIPWGASSFLSAIASGNLHGVIQTTFPLTVSLLASQPFSSWEAQPHSPQLELCPPSVTMPALGWWTPADASARAVSQLPVPSLPCHRPGTLVSMNALPNSRKIKSGHLTKFCLWLFEPITSCISIGKAVKVNNCT